MHVYSRFLKTSLGKLFHSLAPATVKERPPTSDHRPTDKRNLDLVSRCGQAKYTDLIQLITFIGKNIQRVNSETYLKA